MTTLPASRDLNMLFGLRVLLEESNVTRAAVRMGIGQPAMSGILSRLRGHYGDELLARVGRDYELTPLARALLPHVQEATAAIERLLGIHPRVFDPGESSRSFTILSTGYGGHLLHPGVSGAARRAPGIRIEMINGQLDPAPRAWLEHDLVLSPTVGSAEYRSVLLFEDRFVCVTDRDHPFARRGGIEWAEFATSGFAVGDCGDDIDGRLRQVLMSRGLDLRPMIDVESPATALRIVRNTDLVAIVPERLARTDSWAEGVTVLEPPFGAVPITLYLCRHAARDADPGLQWLVEVLRQGAMHPSPTG
ncbi:MAG: LysR family transcriptional regulator [Microbacterium sp.]|uniref:LysR family transcriptional regulator n=1 Tax=Microbacterium sp. TaxID=51671 RepID=UPI0039E466D0